jgi:localization factor PodJL
VREVIGRIDATEREQMQATARFEGELQATKSETQGLAQRLKQFEQDATGPGAAEALKLAGRIEAAEREQLQVAARFESELQAAKSETLTLAQRLKKVEDEAAGPRSAEALKAIEGSVSRVAATLYDSDHRSRAAIGELQGRLERLDAADQASGGAMRELRLTCEALDERLKLSERSGEDGVGRAAAELAVRVDEAREQLAVELAAAADARFDRVEQALAQMGEHVRAAEQRSATALERMGREVLDVAQALSRRVGATERHGADAVEHVRAEVSRIAGAVEDRLVRADSVQAQALEKLGGEIARITERLAERIGNAERRSAQAIDDVGEQVARFSERINQRNDRVASELADRIRQSEERTAKLLEEARQKIDERLAETQRKLAEAAAPPPPARPLQDPDDELFAKAPFPGYETPAPEQRFGAAASSSFGAASSPFGGSFPARAPEPAFDDEDFAAAARFDPSAKSVEESMPIVRPPPASPDDDFDAVELEPNVGFDVDDDFVQAPRPMARPLAAAAAPAQRTVAEELPAAESPRPVAASADPPPSPIPPPLTTREVIERARAAARASSDRDGSSRLRQAKPADDGVLQGLAFGRSRRRPGPSGALMIASLLAAIGLSAGGYVFFEGKPSGKLPKRVADSLSVVPGGAADGADGGPPLAALALAPKPADAAPGGPDLSGAYSAAVAKVAARQAGGLADIKKLADGGYAPAEFYLAELYQDGKSGLAKDPSQSRHWLEKAAEGGDRTAMHNLALDEHEGVGGARNAAAAAEWFRRAAELGLLDSQFNLAALYEHGDGVSQNSAEAYKWYLVAGRSGDAESRNGALRVRAGLTPDARAVAERAAAEFQPATPSSASLAASPAAQATSPDLVVAQRALNQLGYYQGPTDGAASPALHLALAAYQRDQALPVTGATDPATLAKLSVYTR